MQTPIESQEPCRCLLLSCSQAKISTPNLLPAIRRYDGPAFRVLRKFLAEVIEAANKLDILILSAQFGLITSDHMIPDYDRRMSPARAVDLREQVMHKLHGSLSVKRYDELFVSMGDTYRLAIEGVERAIPPTTTMIVSTSPSGRKLAELKTWLYQPYGGCVTVVRTPQPNAQRRASIRLRGVEIELTHDEAIAKGRQALHTDPNGARRYLAWYAVIDGTPVAPKWLVSQISGVPVRSFVADEARRVLEFLGIPVYPIENSDP